MKSQYIEIIFGIIWQILLGNNFTPITAI
jgi:hypothetical protein